MGCCRCKFGRIILGIRGEEDEEFEEPQPQEPGEYEKYPSDPIESIKTSSANIMNVVKENSIDNLNQSSVVNMALFKSNMMLSKNLESGIKENLFYPSDSKFQKLPSNDPGEKKLPSKKLSSDKRKRVVNVHKSKVSENTENGRPFSKTGHISDLNHYRSNERIK